MKPARRLRWRGPVQQQRVREELERRLGAWLQGWSVDGRWLSLAPSDAGALGEFAWQRAQLDGASAWVGMPSNALLRFGARLAAIEDWRSELGARIGRRALQALLATWLGGEGASFDEEAPAPEDVQARFGGLRFQLQGGDFAASVVIDAAACDRIAPPAAAPRQDALVARAAALGNEPVELQVRLSLGDARLADTHELRVGDVLVSSTPIDALFDLVHKDARPLASGQIRRHDRRLAFALQSAAPTSRKQA
jgi:hypothetical protein